MSVGRNLLSPAMEIKTQEEADVYFEKLVQEALKECPDRESAEKMTRDGLGYYAGYYSHETRLRVERLFRCEHPYLGAAANGVPSPDEIFNLGKKLGELFRSKGKSV